MLTFLIGFIASIAHVVTGPDHLAAVTPLAIDSRKKSWMIGLGWGIGHTSGMLLIGLLFVLFKQVLPIEALSKHSEFIIGFLLIGIGTWALFRMYRRHVHGNKPHTHFHEEPHLYAHVHHHTHQISPSHEHVHEHVHSGTVRKNALTALAVGVVHGFAGFSHLFALLPSLALPTVMDSIIYVTGFAIGTLSTMVLFAFILGIVAFQSAVKNKLIFLKWFTIGGGVLAILIGIYWIWSGV
jgi:ABC-type nickel/cobalt efflux system permease component RcnA